MHLHDDSGVIGEETHGEEQEGPGPVLEEFHRQRVGDDAGLLQVLVGILFGDLRKLLAFGGVVFG